MLNGGAVLWRSTRQSTASTGTAEAECKASGFAGQQLITLRDLMDELGFEQPSVRMIEDNSATVTPSHDEEPANQFPVGDFTLLGSVALDGHESIPARSP